MREKEPRQEMEYKRIQETAAMLGAMITNHAQRYGGMVILRQTNLVEEGVPVVRISTE